MNLNRNFIDPLIELDKEQPGFLNNLINIYKKSSCDIVKTMKSSLVTGELETIKKQAHSLKSSSLTLGLQEVSDISLYLERESLHQSLSVLNIVIEKLDKTNQESIEELNNLQKAS